MITYLTSISSLVLIFMLLASGLNLQWGHTGLINFGHVAFFAAGAYTTALLTLGGVPVFLGIAAGILIAVLLALPLGWLTVRLKADYLAVVTIGFSEALRLVLMNAPWFGGPKGLPGVPRFFSGSPREIRPYLLLLLLAGILTVVLLLLYRMTESPFGRVLRSIRDEEVAAETLGKNVVRYKTVSLAMGSAIAGLAGALYAHWVGFVSPAQFTPLVTFQAWTGIVLGGSSHVGAVLGAGVLAALFEGTRFLAGFGIPIETTEMAFIRFIIVGLGLIALLRLRPQGFWPYRPRLRQRLQRRMREERAGRAFVDR